MENFTIIQKDTFSIEIDVVDDRTGAPIDISGQTMFFIVKKLGDLSPNDSLAKINITATLSGTQAQNGQFIISLNSLQTDLPVNTYEYDIILQITPISRKTILQGLINIIRTGKKS